MKEQRKKEERGREWLLLYIHSYDKFMNIRENHRTFTKKEMTQQILSHTLFLSQPITTQGCLDLSANQIQELSRPRRL